MSSQNKIIIQSESSGVLRLGPRYGEYLDLELEHHSLRASTKIYLYEDNVSLLSFFEGLSQRWQGWDDIKTWSSVEGDLKLSSSIDSLGHVSFGLDMANTVISPGWLIKTTLVVDAGSLALLAQQARNVLS